MKLSNSVQSAPRLLAGEPPDYEQPQSSGDDPTEHLELDGISALAKLLSKFYGIAANPAIMRHELQVSETETTPAEIVRAGLLVSAKLRHYKARDLSAIARVRRPFLVARKSGKYLVIGPRFANGLFPVIGNNPDAAKSGPVRISIQALLREGPVEIVLLTSRNDLPEELSRFGFRWFLDTIWRYRRPLVHVLVASFFIQIFGLVTPLFFQVTIDKVLTHRSSTTLLVIVVGLVLIGIFDVTLQYLRSYLLSHTSSRIDVELGARLCKHLFKLPIAYFESRPAGQTLARVRELETVRAFLTGQAMNSLIDVLFTGIYLLVLFNYSVSLALTVLGTAPLYLLVAIVIRPLLREKTKERFLRGALSQQFLVESVVGAHTVKALALESMVSMNWCERLAAYVRTSFQALMISSIGQSSIQYLSKITGILVLYFGAVQVIEGNMTVGGLVAFNMISSQVFAPILRLSQLWQDFQQVHISVERLGDIFNTAPEPQSDSFTPSRHIVGGFRLRNVHFRYEREGAAAIDGISLEIRPGQSVGIVGPSGSGKSTLAKLLLRLYLPQRGSIELDGIDISHANVSWLRRQMGVVLQDNLLFNKTIRENIAVLNPDMGYDALIRVASLAGAHEFISALPNGYESPVVERGANLSGGQRQRIAIARALAADPKILVFDEATSALDYESERSIQDNMREIVSGRTAIIIAHRLATVRHCDRIVSLRDGRIVEDGSHDELLSRPNGLYAGLWKLQFAEREA